jgi:hypothetical protein
MDYYLSNAKHGGVHYLVGPWSLVLPSWEISTLWTINPSPSPLSSYEHLPVPFLLFWSTLGNSWCRVSFFLLVNPGQFLVQGLLFPSGLPWAIPGAGSPFAFWSTLGNYWCRVSFTSGQPWAIPGAGSPFSFWSTLGNSWCRVSFFLLVYPGQFLVQGLLSFWSTLGNSWCRVSFPFGHPSLKKMQIWEKS